MILKIAIVSFEYAGVADGGGIGTYARNASEMLSNSGHKVHVFTSGASSQFERLGVNLVISRVAGSRINFSQAVSETFCAFHCEEPFDLIEGPEYGCDASVIIKAYPELPFAVRLHGPSFSIAKSNAEYVRLGPRMRFALGALRRGRWPRDPWKYDPLSDPERVHVLKADEIVANSRATAEFCDQTWGLPKDRLSIVPLPFSPAAAMLAADAAPTSRTILFLGRLEVRKGVLELAKAIPSVVSRYPDVTFRLVGHVLPHPGDGRPLRDHVIELAGSCVGNIEIVGGVPYESIVDELARASICVFPSDWEAAGFVCMEAMAAARAVVGSASGGMAEIIEHGRTGLLVPHRDPSAIAEALIDLLGSPEKCEQLGLAARKSVVDRFAPETILPLQLAAYERAIANAGMRSLSQRYGTD